MRKLFLDTSAYSSFKKGAAEAVEAIREADEIGLNAIIIGELLSGFDGGRFAAANRRELKEFLSSPVVLFQPMTEETAERYAVIYHHLKERGTPIPTNDLWIAATAMETGTVLLTADRHFLKVPQIQTLMIV